MSTITLSPSSATCDSESPLLDSASGTQTAHATELPPLPEPPVCKCFEGDRRDGRNLVVCIDGTSNQFSATNTNVVELYNRLIKDDTQLTFYTSGIGTYARPSWLSPQYIVQAITSVLDLAIAWRFGKIVLSAYLWLSENYRRGDRIFLFGFSRGAYQVRVLSAMVGSVGLLHKGNQDQIPFAYQLYAESEKRRKADEKILGKRKTTRAPSPEEDPQLAESAETEPTAAEVLENFKHAFSHRDVRVHFVGAWDTVSSVGVVYDKTLPGTTNGMYNTCFFRHALALDERRVKFLPEYVNGGEGPAQSKAPPATETADVDAWGPVMDTVENRDAPGSFPHTKEVWFAGSHADIGGGAVLNFKMRSFGPALRWMSFEAILAGLKLELAPQSWIRRPQPYNSMTWMWRIFEWLPITQLSYKHASHTCVKRHLEAPRRIQRGQLVHETAIEEQAADVLAKRAQFAPELELDWSKVAAGVGSCVELDPYTAIQTVFASIPAVEGRVPMSQLQRHIVLSLKEIISTAPGRRAVRDAHAAFLARAGTASAVASPLAILDSLLTTCILEAPRKSRASNPVAIALMETVPDLVRTLEGCGLQPQLAYRGPIDEMIPILLSAKTREDIELVGRVLGPRPCAAPLAVSSAFADVILLSYLPEDNAHILCVSESAGAEIWDIQKRQRIVSPTSNFGARTTNLTALSPSGKMLVVGWWTGRLEMLSLEGAFSLVAEAIIDVHVSSATQYQKHAAEPETAPTSDWSVAVLTCIAVAPEEGHLIAGWDDGTIAIYTLPSFDLLCAVPRAHTERVHSVACSPVNSTPRFVSASWDCTVKIWDWAAGPDPPHCTRTLEGHTADINHAVFSPGGARVASASDDGTIGLWSVGSEATVARFLRGHDGPVLAVVFSLGGDRLLSASRRDGTLRLWDATSGAQVCVYSESVRRSSCVVFNAAGDIFASVGEGGELRLWDEWSNGAIRKVKMQKLGLIAGA